MVKLVQNAFVRGQLDFELMGRQDFDGYTKGASRLENFNIQRQGSIKKRQGFDRVLDLTSLTDGNGANLTAETKIRLIPFAYEKNRGFVLVLVPGKMYAVETTKNTAEGTTTIINIYTVEGANGVYAADEIHELDYQQCGDVMFIAHQNHPPARIVHSIERNESMEYIDAFTYEECNFSYHKDGIPTINGATVKRMAVSNNAGLKVEEYKVAAVFDGQETFPCTAYSNGSFPSGYNPGTWKSWNGTVYYMPWTDSQTITLAIGVETRRGESGEEIFPEKILVYKKNFNYFGLIGTVELKSSTSQGTVKAYVDSTPAHDTALPGFVQHGKRTIWRTYDGAAAAKDAQSGYIDIKLGKVTVADGTQTGTKTISYLPNKQRNMLVLFDNNPAPKGTADLTKFVQYDTIPAGRAKDAVTLTKGQSETADAFAARVEEAKIAFEQEISDERSFRIPLTKDTGSAQLVTIVPGLLGEEGVGTSNTQATDTTAAIDGTKDLIIESAGFRYYEQSKNVEFIDKYYTPDSSITPLDTPNEDELVFNGEGNYPGAVSMSQQRLVWASSKNDPARIWMSTVGDFYNYEQHEVTTDDDPIDFIMPVTRFARINHIAEMRRLLMFNSACEWMVDSASSASGMTHKTIQAYPQSYSGSSDRIKPIICNNAVLFASRSCQAVRRFAYDLSADGFAGKDISILSSSIFRNNSIRDWTYQQFPNSMVWMVLADGTLASLTYMEEQDIIAWGTHRLGGGGKAVAVATTYSMAPALDELEEPDERPANEDYANATQEEVFLAVRRGTSLWLERMRTEPKEEDKIYHQLCMDSMRVLGGDSFGKGLKPRHTEEGLKYVRQTCTSTEAKSFTAAKDAGWFKADGDGGWEVDEANVGTDEIYEGFQFEAVFVSTFPILTRATVGAWQFDIKNIQSVGMRLYRSYGGEVAAYTDEIPEDNWAPVRYDDREDKSPQFDGAGNAKMNNLDIQNIAPIGLNTRDGRVAVRQGIPWPFSILTYEMNIVSEREAYR